MEQYRLLELLGEGGMGVVHRALQVSLEREVAVKLIRPSGGDPDVEDVVRFRRETGILIGLAHPNIVKVYDVGRMGGKLFLAMELIGGPDLASLLRDTGKLSPDLVVSVLDQVLDALDYIHGKDLVHRDVKPGNIMLESDGRVVLMDFGLAKGVQDTLLTVPGCVMGTPYYLSPEMGRGAPATAASDLWALGVTAYELLSGSRPFAGSSFARLVAAVTSEAPAPLVEVCPGLSKELAAWVQRCLEKDPANRFRSASHAREAVRRIELWHGAARAAAESLSRHPDRVRRAPGRTGARLRMAGALAGCMVALILYGAYLLSAVERPGDVRAALRGARLTVRFRTSAPSRWSLRAGPNVVTEESDRTDHKLEATVSPWSPPGTLTLESRGRTVDVAAPESPAGRVHRLAGAVRQSRIAAGDSSDKLWKRVRSRTRSWLSVRYRKAVVAQVARQPEVLAPLKELEAALRSSDLAPAWASIRDDLGSLLADRDLPPDLRDEVLGALWCLDRIDCVAGFMGQPPVFGVQQALQPAMVLSCRPASGPGVGPAAGTVALFPAPGKPARGLYPAAFLPMVREVRGSDFFGANVEVLNEELGGADADIRLVFAVPPGGSGADERSEGPPTSRCPARPEGEPVERGLQFRLSSLPDQSYLRLTPPGWRVGLPVRLPDGIEVDMGKPYLFTVRLRGGLAGPPGEWLAEHLLAIEDTPRHGCVIRGVDLEVGRR